jgi:hypothetical protein
LKLRLRGFYAFEAEIKPPLRLCDRIAADLCEG